MSGSKGTRPFQPTAVEAQLIREGKDAVAALRHVALFAAGVRGGPGAWRWSYDPMGTTLDDAAAWERLLGDMRAAACDAWCACGRRPIDCDGSRAGCAKRCAALGPEPIVHVPDGEAGK